MWLAALFAGCADPVGACPVDGQFSCFTRDDEGACLEGARPCDAEGRGIGPCVGEVQVAADRCIPAASPGDPAACPDQVAKLEGEVRVRFDQGQTFNGFTAGAWVLPTGLAPDGEDGVLIHAMSGEQSVLSLALVSDGAPSAMALELRYGERCVLRASNRVPLDRWTHVAMALSPLSEDGVTTAQLFIDGRATSSTPCVLDNGWDNNTSWFLGARPAGMPGYPAARSFSGYVDDVFAEGRARDANFAVGPDYDCPEQARSVIDFSTAVGPSGCGLGDTITVVEGSPSPALGVVAVCQPTVELP